jgi:hypothetical protein
VELAARLREHFRLPGLNESTASFFRDKLAMRVQARACGIRIPDFVPLFNHDQVRHFLATVPPPWLMKPRYGGVTISLARQEWPDTSGFTDAEIVYRLKQKHHVGLVVRSPSAERVEAMLTEYGERIARDFHAALPPASKATA